MKHVWLTRHSVFQYLNQGRVSNPYKVKEPKFGSKSKILSNCINSFIYTLKQKEYRISVDHKHRLDYRTIFVLWTRIEMAVERQLRL